MKILIIFLPGLGNAVLLTPMLKALKSSFPQSSSHMLIKLPIVEELLEGSGLVDEFILYNKTTHAINNLRRQLGLIQRLRNHKYDVVVSTASSGLSKESMLTWAIPASTKIGYYGDRLHNLIFDKVVKFSDNEHEVDRRLKLVASLGADPVNREPFITLNEEDKDFARKIREKVLSCGEKHLLVGIHPGSSEALKKKRWSPERFAKVADILSESYNAQIIIFGGKNEVKLGNTIKKLMEKTEPTLLTGKTTIKQTASTIGECDLFISNDSGLMHVAAAVNTPVVSIFGPTSIEKNFPLGNRDLVVSKPCSQRPCGFMNENRKCPDGRKCLMKIKVEDILVKVNKII